MTDLPDRPWLSVSTSIRNALNLPAGTSTVSSLIARYLNVEVTVPSDLTWVVQEVPGLRGSLRMQYGSSYTVPSRDTRKRPLSVTRTSDVWGRSLPSASRPTVTTTPPSVFSTAVTTSVYSDVPLLYRISVTQRSPT